ncbi:hypothetical protein LTR17_006996 [Elasticomyces elasticus]|nr:hypothetical protein LTR17_006996 [Elasticomyces elasticus]
MGSITQPGGMEGVEMGSGFTSVNTPYTLAVAAPPALPPPSTGAKRKRDAQLKFYAVKVGKTPGIYHTWAECLDQVKGFPKSVFKSFTSLTDAQAFVAGETDLASGTAGSGKNLNPQKWYGVQCGRVPGVYTVWDDVLNQIRGWKGPKHKVFKSRIEAELFVKEGTQYHQQVHGMNGDAMESIEMNETPRKRAKITIKPEPGLYEHQAVEYAPGEAPLNGAEDDFDHNITLDRDSANASSLRYKTDSERSRTTYTVARPVRLAPIRIYTDGSSLANGRAEAVGGVGVYFGPGNKLNISEGLPGSKQTNQRAELTAVLRALEVSPKDRRLEILTDSKYSIQCCTEWFRKWRSNNWINAAGKAVENKDLVSKIIDNLEERYRMNSHRQQAFDEADEAEEYEVEVNDVAVRGHWDRGPAGVKFIWVKGHAKDVGNEAADGLATAGARDAKEMIEAVEDF